MEGLGRTEGVGMRDCAWEVGCKMWGGEVDVEEGLGLIEVGGGGIVGVNGEG